MVFPFVIHAQWTPQATGFTQDFLGLWDISIANENTVWAIAYDADLGVFDHVPEFTKTTNGGVTWTPGDFPGGYFWSNISAISADTAWVAVVDDESAADGAIFKTTDGGVTWNEQGADEIFNSSSYVNFVYFWNASEGVAVGDPNPGEFEIYTTTDGGDLWVPVPGSAIPDPLPDEFGIFRNYCTVGNDIWFSTIKARIFHSTDKGLTWSVSDTGIPVDTLFDGMDIAFWNSNEGIARRYDPDAQTNMNVVRTNDGGASWNPVTVSGPFFGSYAGGIAYVPGTASTLVSTGFNNDTGSSYSNDGGSTWTLIDEGVQHYIARFYNNTTGWCAGFNTSPVTGGIFKYTGNPLHTKNTQSGKEISFLAYPNPGNGHVMVQLNNGENADLRLSLADQNGRIVYQKSFGKPGEFFLRSLDFSTFPKGAYVLKLENGVLNHAEEIIIR